MNTPPPINKTILAVKVAFGNLHDECDFTKLLAGGVVECTFPGAESIFPECRIEECPLLNDTSNALRYMQKGPLA